MNSKLALVLIVAIVGIAECKPNADLRARMIAKAQAAKRGADEWPYGWFEYASLVGKCVGALNWLEFLEMDPPKEGMLAEACPKAIELAESMKDSSDDDEQKLNQLMKDMFPLLQCVNLQAEREEVFVAVSLNDKNAEEDVFLKESQQLADVCEKVYESAKKEEETFKDNLKKMSSEKRENAMDMLRRFLSTKKA
ncbi:uncharacterized protein LOC132724519 isoform X2 [Ruditapes philippinarum]|uniref:uncharacterized protein LOC132724519 isoform X1 n=1 Tax=Ruditapes philippinarum TaxID=129788 RepID=UPI00295A6D3B|nr:uncharacterized protein LOC132724519 isoform X1 [Ruditapes philippinarum]XP_060565370.1 uncharacterized protein LOC132724519 isoform X2 [Ruditapes philippinarum]